MLEPDGGVGGSIGAAAAIGASIGEFAAAAASGAVAVNETGGNALLAAIHNMTDWIDTNLIHLQHLGTKPKLGSSAGAKVISPYVAEVATDSQGFLPMLLKFRESLDSAEGGIKDAMKNYQAMDQRGAGRQQAV